MRRLFYLLLICAVLAAGSYAGARFTALTLIGDGPNALGAVTTHFAFSGVPTLPGKPRAWVLAYPAARDFGPGGVVIYVGPAGDLLGTKPTDLAERIAAQRPVLP